MIKTIGPPPFNLLLGAGLAALTLQACSKPAQTSTTAVTSAPTGALALDSSGLPPPPAPAALPPAPPAPVAYAQAPRQRYRWVDRAAALNGAFADSPPDYTVDYNGSRPWIWRARDGSYRVVEHTADGDRYYYYDPGADEPYLVRGPDYSYGYDQGRLAAVYDSEGRALDDAQATARAERAGAYLARARQLYYAAAHQRHEAAVAADWQDRREAQFAEERQWEADQQNDADWRAWHQQNAYQPPVYVQERDSRAAYAATIGAAAVGGFVAGRATAPDNGGHVQAPGYAGPRNPGVAPSQIGGQQATAVAAARQQQAQADAARQAQLAGARQQQAQADQARVAQQRAQADAVATARQQQAQADQARLAQQRAQANTVATARQQQAQAYQARLAQQRVQTDAAREAQAAGQQRAAAARQAQTQAEAARQSQAVAARAQAVAQSQEAAKARADAAHQQGVQAEAARQAQATQARNADMARQAQARNQAQASRQAAEAQAAAARASQSAAQAKAAHPPAPPATAPKPAPVKRGPPADDRRGDHPAAQP